MAVERGGQLWVYRQGWLEVSTDSGETSRMLAPLAMPRGERLVGRSRLARRFLRSGILDLLPLPSGAALGVVRGSILRLPRAGEVFDEVMACAGKTMRLEVGLDGTVYAAEYFFNGAREPVRIYASGDDGCTWNEVFRFPAGAIRHVHAIVYCSQLDRLAVLTGDLDGECMVLLADPEFDHIEVIGQGSQRFRACGLAEFQGGFLLPTDTPFEQNYVQHLSLDGRLERLCPLPGSCLSVARAGKWYFFGTAVEPSPVNRDSSACLYGTMDGAQWLVIGRWRADWWSSGWPLKAAVFQMPRVILPRTNHSSPYLYASPIAVRHGDGDLIRWPVAGLGEEL